MRMRRALDEVRIEGVRTTVAFHKKMMVNSDFVEASSRRTSSKKTGPEDGIPRFFRRMFTSREQEDRVSLSRKVQAHRTTAGPPETRHLPHATGGGRRGVGPARPRRRPLREGRVFQQGDRGSAPDAEARPKEQRLPEMADPASCDEGLSSDAQAELRKVASDPTRFTSDDSGSTFSARRRSTSRRTPARLYICDISGARRNCTRR